MRKKIQGPVTIWIRVAPNVPWWVQKSEMKNLNLCIMVHENDLSWGKEGTDWGWV